MSSLNGWIITAKHTRSILWHSLCPLPVQVTNTFWCKWYNLVQCENCFPFNNRNNLHFFKASHAAKIWQRTAFMYHHDTKHEKKNTINWKGREKTSEIFTLLTYLCNYLHRSIYFLSFGKHLPPQHGKYGQKKCFLHWERKIGIYKTSLRNLRKCYQNLKWFNIKEIDKIEKFFWRKINAVSIFLSSVK